MQRTFWRTTPTALVVAVAFAAGSAAAHETDLFCPAGAAVFADYKLQVKRSDIFGGESHEWTHVGTNRDAKLYGPGTIHGDLVVGGEVKDKHDFLVTGSVVEDAPQVVLRDVHDLVASHEALNDNADVGPTTFGNDPFKSPTEIEVKDGDSLFLPGGEYYLTKLKLDKNATLILGGPVRIFMPKGKVYVKYGSSIVAGSDEASLLIVMAGKGGIKISKSSRVHAGIYAPHAKLYVKYASHLHGGAVVDKLKLQKDSAIYVADVCGEGLPEPPADPVPPVADFEPDPEEDLELAE